MGTLKVTWYDGGRWAQEQPDPRFPDGVDLDISNSGWPSCSTALPYPARRCGYYLIECSRCGYRGVCTTAGRADDPRSIKFNCRRTT